MCGVRRTLFLCGWAFACGASASTVGLHSMGFPALIQTPSARMPEAGSIGFGVSRALPYDTLFLSASPFDWLNASVRYTDTNIPFTDSNTLHDKGVNVQARLWTESLWRPAAAVGIIDAGGTGLFSAEYLVFNKRWYDLDVSAGIGWGRLGAAADARNPAAELSDRFQARDEGTRGQGGIPSVSNWFSGDEVAFFGGLHYTPYGRPWSFMLEWEGNDYSDETNRGAQLKSSSRLNGGFEYRFRNDVRIKASYERGNTLGLMLAVSPRLGAQPRDNARLRRPPDPISPPAFRMPAAGESVETEEERLRQFHRRLRSQQIYVQSVDLDEASGVATLWYQQSLSAETAIAVGRMGRALANHYPERFHTYRLVELAGGQETATVTLPAATFVAAAQGELTVEELALATTVARGLHQDRALASHPQLARYPAFAYGVNPALRSNIGGPDAFYAGQLLLKPYLSFQASRNLNLTASWAFDSGLSNLDQIGPREVPTRLPPVRTELERYQRESGGSYLSTLAANYLFTLAPEVYGRFSAGIFEEMYGGVAHELLYKPHDARWAVGYNINRVRKRDYRQRFEFLDFETTTGHLTGYWESPVNRVRVILSAGRYLAGDVGATLDISKSFRNGFRIGGFATKTNVSSEEFGEGSFDKGVYLYIPIDLLSSVRGVGGLNVQYRFITRDGGAKVNDGRPLYSVFDRGGGGPMLESMESLLK